MAIAPAFFGGWAEWLGLHCAAIGSSGTGPDGDTVIRGGGMIVIGAGAGAAAGGSTQEIYPLVEAGR